MRCTIGLMSGTSLDGVDAVLAQWPEPVPSGEVPPRPRELGFVHVPMPAALGAELLALNRSGRDELHRSALAANALARLYARAVDELLAAAGKTGPTGPTGTQRSQVRALGAHGQTVRHRPGEFDGTGYTLQLLNGALLAELSGIDVVCDLRSRDVAAGGQGAPLVPAFHAELFGDASRDVAVLNVGGIANLTLLPRQGGVLGFDCGPGNLLMDHWMQRQPVPGAFDADGRLAARGEVLPELLRRCLADPFFERAPPKSTGRDLFDGPWLDHRLVGLGDSRPEDVMATLAELTAAAAIGALRRHAPSTRQLYVCGGGAFNGHLMRRLGSLAGAGAAVGTTAAAGIAPDRVEALAFAWLARAHCERRPGNLSSVTGAAGPRLLGALYPAS
ncbi:MAG: anhydro-N-acetylmuramic acid kinase [Rubrivivax sp.]|nr:anhydro-N-acetylmuramic acid kinase [Rubrivivax sp.]